jgi:hypothetical protein
MSIELQVPPTNMIKSVSFASVDTALRQIFSTPQDESLVAKSRRIMGETVTSLSDEELEIFITELKHLIDYWLDGYERASFDGQTLQQILGT